VFYACRIFSAFAAHVKSVATAFRTGSGGRAGNRTSRLRKISRQIEPSKITVAARP
jgi:hypothetical protein